MNVRSCIAAAAIALMPMLSQASVVYEWTTTNNVAPHGVSLRMEFDDAVVQRDSLDFDYSGEGHRSAWLPPELGLISLSFALFDSHGVHFTQDTGVAYDGPFYQLLRMHVGFGEYMTGYIEAGNFETAFTMQAKKNDNVFEVTDLVSDAPLDGKIGCTSPTIGPCAGATGVIQRVNDVPEPGSLALIGAGLFAASRIRRRKSQ
jgi:hypothetical protein